MNSKNKISIILGAAAAAVSLFLTIGVKTIFHACGAHEGGAFGSCHYAEQAVFAAGIAMTVQCIILLAAKSRSSQAPLSAAICALAIVTAIIPNAFIPLCMMPSMRCLAIMRPAVICCSAAVAVISLINMIINIRGTKD